MISRLHAKISRKGDHFYIECDSLNGVLVNSVKRKKYELQNDDVVVFGGAGAKTAEGSVVTNSLSELVYVFQSQQKCISNERKSCNNESRRATISSIEELSKGTVTTSLQVPKTIKNITATPLKINTNLSLCDVDSGLETRPFHCGAVFEHSPGEGTSDGRVKRSKNIIDCDDITHTDKQSSQDDMIIFKRKKKRNRMPFDSDEESPSSPYRKLLKKDSSQEIERLNDRDNLQSEINENKVFLNDLNEELLCCICRELLVLAHALPCSHTFCYVCIRNWLKDAVDCPSCRSRASFHNLVPVKVLDNMVEKVAVRVLSPDELEERNTKIQELQARINGRMEEDSVLRAGYGCVSSDKEFCEKCNLSISNRLLRWVVSFPKTSSMACYHFKCFKPSSSITISQVKLASELSKKDMTKIKTIVKK